MTIADHPFLKGLPPPVLEAVSALAREERFAGGKLLIRAGAPADRFLLVQSGLVALVAYDRGRKPVVLQHLSGGDPLGWSWLVPPHEYRFDVIAIDATEVFVLDGTRLRELCLRRPDVGVEMLRRLMTVMASRLDAARRKLITDPTSATSGGPE